MRNFITFFLLGLFLIPFSLVLALVYPFSKKAAKKMSDFCVKKVPVGVFGILYKRGNLSQIFKPKKKKSNF